MLKGSREAFFKTASFRTAPNDRLWSEKPPTRHCQDSLSTLVTVTSASFLVIDEPVPHDVAHLSRHLSQLVQVTREVY